MQKFRLEGDPHEAEMVECEFGEFVKLEDVEEEIKRLNDIINILKEEQQYNKSMTILEVIGSLVCVVLGVVLIYIAPIAFGQYLISTIVNREDIIDTLVALGIIIVTYSILITISS